MGEADSILTFFTPSLGKIQGFARSLRKPKSKMAGHLELLTHSQVSFARGRNLDTITGGQTIDSFLPLKSDLWLTSCGLYVAELVNQFAAEHQENLPLFQLTLDTLQRLCDEDNKDLVLRYFELRLLDTAGYRPQLRQCVACHRLLEPVVNSFSPSAGGMLCPDCAPSVPFARPVPVNTLKVLRLLQGSDFATAGRVKIDAELNRQLEGLIGDYLKHLLEKEVKSAVWLETLREQYRPSL
ncbi:MAG: DNA repair protein RecO [Chloroflexi bacterium RBG_16_60_22]|nr:MAG: DNA repair protein RecO [Chloroflexi bacterium RBG_16_60_22]